MTLNGLWRISHKFFSNEKIQEIWDKNLKIELENYSDYLQIDYQKYGFEFVKGSISSTGIHFDFRKKNYDLSVSRFTEAFNDDMYYDSVLLIPHYTSEHFASRKSGTIRQSAKDVRTEKEFLKLQKTIAKRFPFSEV